MGITEPNDGISPFPYIGDQLHKSHAGYQRIGKVIAGVIIAACGNSPKATRFSWWCL
ncbi:MAG: hypothetical protein IJF34_05900 [Clostridia bacterium]|nr:hypothetical protein [Clostridia bacterium]